MSNHTILTGKYSPNDHLLHQHFRVTGEDEPNWPRCLVLPNTTGDTLPKWLQISEETRARMRKIIGEHIRTAYNTKRDVAQYEAELNFRPGGLKDFLKKLTIEMRIQKARILDWGCGSGTALSQMLDWPEVERKGSIGVTLPSEPTASEKPQTEQLVIANILHLLPREERYHAVLSVIGGIEYHPFNKRVQGYEDRRVALINALGFVKQGGYLLSPVADNINGFTNFDLRKLQEMGIIVSPQEDRLNFGRNNRLSAAKLIRKPTTEEVMEYIATESDGTYALNNWPN